MSRDPSEVRVFYSYSHRDERFREQLEEHLAIFKRLGLIASWSDREITPGNEWRSSIDSNLEMADLILLLVSSSFIASDYCYDKELSHAMSKHENGSARVVPIFVRPAEWSDAPFEGLQGLPNDARSVSEWENEDLAWKNIAIGLKYVLAEIKEQKSRIVTPSRMKTIQQALTETIEEIDDFYNRESTSEIEGISSGLVDLDRLTRGLHKGELFVIAARPSFGKTALALNIASAVGEKDQLPTLVFSTKLSAKDVSRRMIAARARINRGKVATGRFEDDDWSRLTHAIQTMVESVVLIDDSPSITFSELRERCFKEKANLGEIALVVVDSIQYLVDDTNNENSSENMGRFFKSLARELDAAVIVVSPISRSVEARPNKRPLLGDVGRYSGLIDEADVVAFIYVDSFYNVDSIESGTAELILAKNHHGPIGTIKLTHLVQYGSFQSYVGIDSSKTEEEGLGDYN